MTTFATTKSFEELNPRMDTPKESCCDGGRLPCAVPSHEDLVEASRKSPPPQEWYDEPDLTKPDMVNAPPHYHEMNPQPIDVIESWGLDFHRAQVLKYVARAPNKGAFVEDLKKARWYLDRLIAIEEGR